MISISFCFLIHRWAWAYKTRARLSLWALAKNKTALLPEDKRSFSWIRENVYMTPLRETEDRAKNTDKCAHTRAQSLSNHFPSAPQVRHVWSNDPHRLALCVKLLVHLWCEIVRDSLIFCLNGSLRRILAGWRRFNFQRNIDCSGALSYTWFFHSLSICKRVCVIEKHLVNSLVSQLTQLESSYR